MNDGLNFANSYYVASANSFAPAPKLEGEAKADVVVIGGGYTGLHAALECRERGFSVALVEAGRIGWGASGRNGGQAIPGWRKGAAELIKLYGREHAKRLFDLSLEARQVTLDRIAKHNIACDLTMNGHLLAASKSVDLGWMREEARILARDMDYPHVRVLDRDEAQAKLASPIHHGALLDALGGHLHPLNYALGLADAAREGGVTLYEQTPALNVDGANGVTVTTPSGAVRARYAVLACDALLGKLEPRIAGRIMPVANYLIATEPLENPSALIADNLAVSDSRFVVDYFRMSADGRLIFGGGERYTPNPPTNIEAFVRPYMERIFPQLANVRITHSWGGLVSISMTRLPHIGRMANLFFAHGYSGQGVLISALAGKVLAEALSGTAERFDVLQDIAPPEFPGGAALRTPLHVLGMLYYALRDRL
ncbi:oxidoreductase [alpha proteobacterium U9-1i]|nr:oxidoreductase [alpha proteobacterium U9-1i]